MVGVSQSGESTMWSSKATFILATIGFSVGLGNIWRFPYLAGESGGGAFVIIYLACVALIGIPIIVAELMIGRRGGMTPGMTMSKLAKEAGRSRFWGIAGLVAIITAFLIVSYYCVIGGWTLHYVFLSASEGWSGVDSAQSQTTFEHLLSDPVLLIFWQLVFLSIVALITVRGLNGGIEKAVSLLMPALFVLLISLAIYGLIVGDAARGLAFLFEPDWTQVTGETFLNAIGQAFFSVGVGMAAMMTYGAYLPKKVNIAETSFIVAFADSAVAIIAGLAVFPFVFANGLSPTEGPGLVFVTLPTAFGDLTGGGVASIAFFALLAVAAITSAIALFEVLAACGEEHGISRLKTAVGAAGVLWAVGLLTVFSLNHWAAFHPLSFLPGFEEATVFDSIDRITATIGLPLGGFLISIFAGHVLSARIVADELGVSSEGVIFRIWRFLLRWPLPAAIALLLIMGVQG
nr:sodium-dependent transporter [Hyphomonas sp. Mor2]